MQTTDEVREKRNGGDKVVRRSIVSCCALLALWAVAFAVALIILYEAYDLQIWGKGIMRGGLTWASYVPEVGINCVLYIAWSFVIWGIFKDFGTIYLSASQGNRRIRIFAVHLLFAFVFTLQVFLTESVADGIARMSWLVFFANHFCGCIYLALIPLSLVVMGRWEKRTIVYAFAACLSYVISFLVALLLPITIAKYRLLLVALMLTCFILLVIDEIRFPEKWQYRFEPNVSRGRKVKSASLYFVICGVYILSIFINLSIGRSAVPSLEDRFFMARVPSSTVELRTCSLTDRDLMRGRMHGLLKDIDTGKSTFVDAAVKIFADPKLYGADYVVTNVFKALAKDGSGNIHRGIDALVKFMAPDLGNGEFAKRLNVQGKLSDISLSQEVVDEITESARKRLLEAGEEPLNFFMVYTRDKRPVLCRVGRDTFNVIRVVDKSNISICDGQVCYGDVDLAITDILTFAPITDPEAFFNESLSSYVVTWTAHRLGLLRDIPVPPISSVKEIFAPEQSENFVRQNSQFMLNEDEVCKIREDFANVVGTKKNADAITERFVPETILPFLRSPIPDRIHCNMSSNLPGVRMGIG